MPIVQEAGWAPGPIWTGAENLGCTGIGSPDQPVASRYTDYVNRPTHMETSGQYGSRAALRTGRNPGASCRAGWVGLSGRLGEKCLVGNRTPDCPNCRSVTILTEPSRLMTV